MDSKFAIKISNLYKRHSKIFALDVPSLNISKGCVIGIIGPNGSGKSTLIKCLTNTITTFSGNIFFNIDQSFDLYKNQIGVLHEDFCLFEGKTLIENIKIITHLKKISDWNTINQLLSDFNLLNYTQTPFGKLSMGNKQRLGLFCALIHNPTIVILDEPTNGLDPSGIKFFREKIKELKRLEKTILVTSHILSELEQYCTHICFINKGRISDPMDIKDILTKYQNVESAFENFIETKS